MAAEKLIREFGWALFYELGWFSFFLDWFDFGCWVWFWMVRFCCTPCFAFKRAAWLPLHFLHSLSPQISSFLFPLSTIPSPSFLEIRSSIYLAFSFLFYAFILVGSLWNENGSLWVRVSDLASFFGDWRLNFCCLLLYLAMGRSNLWLVWCFEGKWMWV